MQFSFYVKKMKMISHPEIIKITEVFENSHFYVKTKQYEKLKGL